MIHSILSNDLAYAIAWTLVHSVWQIALAAILINLVLRFMNASHSQSRYVTALAGLGFCFLMSIITFTTYYIQDSVILVQQATSLTNGEPFSTEPVSDSQGSFLQSMEYYFPLILNFWLIGTMVFMLKIIGAFVYMKSLTKNAKLQSDKLGTLLKQLNKKFGINRKLEIKESSRIFTPMVTGYLKPIILFPIGLANQLSTSEVECIIAHELAHIKRHDFIFNIIQMLAEAIYYYHPGVWYISSKINAERENCCDDLAIACCGSKTSYARTLVKLQEMKNSIKLRPALALSGHSNSFSQRILRILNQGTINTHYREKILAFGLVFLALIFGVGSLNSKAETMEVENPEIYILEDCEVSENSLFTYLDTIPEKQKFHITKMTDSSSVEMKMEDGEIIELKINGKDIDSKEFGLHEDVIFELRPDKNKKIITVLPDSKRKKMRISYIDPSKEIIADSIIEEFEFPELDFYFDDLDHDPKFVYKYLKDSLIRNEMKIMEEQINIDSIFELFPDKMPKVYFHSDGGKIKEKIIVELRESEKSKEQMKHELRRQEKHRLAEETRIKEIKKGLHEKKLQGKLFEWIDEDEDIHVEGFFSPHTLKKDVIIRSQNQNVSDKIMNALLKDGLIQNNEKTDIELGGKFLKVNGDKQPENIWKKYKKIYEDHTGIEMTKKSKLKFELDPSERQEEENIFFRSLPQGLR